MTHINQRRDFASAWASANPVLQLGEIGWERDYPRAKMGDGVTAWNDLPYKVAPSPGLVTSVAGRQGDVVLDKHDVGLSNVDDTSDMNKPISTATAAALSTKADLDDLDDKADIASPTFTGTPSAPTPPVSNNSSQLATTSFVKQQGYAPLASPAFTGTPTAPTQDVPDTSDKVATTAYADAAFGFWNGLAKVMVDRPSRPYAKAIRTAARSIPTDTWTQINLLEGDLSGGIVAGATNGLSLPTLGAGRPLLYNILGEVMYSGNATGRRIARVLHNGAEVGRVQITPGGTGAASFQVSAYIVIESGVNEVALETYQDSGVTLSLLVAGCSLTVAQIG